MPHKQPKVDPPIQELDSSEIAVPTTLDTNKYAPKSRIGKASIGVPNRVERVGLGGLKTITNYGNQSDV